MFFFEKKNKKELKLTGEIDIRNLSMSDAPRFVGSTPYVFGSSLALSSYLTLAPDATTYVINNDAIIRDDDIDWLIAQAPVIRISEVHASLSAVSPAKLLSFVQCYGKDLRKLSIIKNEAVRDPDLDSLWVFLPHIEELVLSLERFVSVNVVAEALRQCPRLTRLVFINNSQFDDKLIRVLRASSRVFDQLVITSSQSLTGDAISKAFDNMRVRNLTLMGPNFRGPSFFQMLNQLEELDQLTLTDTGISRQDLEQLLRQNPFLRSVRVIHPSVPDRVKESLPLADAPGFVVSVDDDTGVIYCERSQ